MEVNIEIGKVNHTCNECIMDSAELDEEIIFKNEKGGSR